jgi:hypothetical protein
MLVFSLEITRAYERNKRDGRDRNRVVHHALCNVLGSIFERGFEEKV